MQLRRPTILLMIDFLELLTSRRILYFEFRTDTIFQSFSLAVFEILIFLVPFRQRVSSILHIPFVKLKMFTLPCLCKNAHCMLIVDT